ncbi:MAG: hypothetical protein HYV09_08045 [Deltaproteobacteria bacterium]|nr:hypothetical protein [Deltaproteobacteria bacterium]
MLRRIATALVALGLVTADEGAAAAADPPKRALPDYDGRPDRDAPREGLGIWIPRVLLFPLRIVHDFGIRAPLRVAVLPFDRKAGDDPDPRDRFDVRPIVVLDLGFKPRFGAHVEAGTAANLLHVRADTFGPTSFALGAAALHAVARGAVSASFDVVRRPDVIFHGFGPRSPDHRARVAVTRAKLALGSEVQPLPWLAVATSFGVRGGRASAFMDDYAVAVQRLEVVLDARPLVRVGASRHGELRRGSGVRAQLDVEHAAGSAASAERIQWIGWGGVLAAFLGAGRGREVELACTVRFVDPTGGRAPPFVEQVVLGGAAPLRGFLEGRLVGRSAIAAAATWRYPVWSFLDGFVLLEAGNAFDAHLRGLSANLLRLSASVGMRSVVQSPWVVELLIGGATDTIADGARPSSLRVLISASRAL